MDSKINSMLATELSKAVSDIIKAFRDSRQLRDFIEDAEISEEERTRLIKVWTRDAEYLKAAMDRLGVIQKTAEVAGTFPDLAWKDFDMEKELAVWREQENS
jgi:hypothetical protein